MAETDEKLGIEEVSQELGIRHAVQKEAKAELDTQKEKFYGLLNAEITANEKLAHKKIDIPHSVDPDEWLKLHHPGWRFADDEKKIGKVVVEEDPIFRKKVYINHADGMVYGRNISQESPSLDDERLKKQEPELWERITRTEEIRVLLEPEDMEDDDFAAMQQYVVPGKLKVSLATPRKAKQDELDA